jgi:hypothetical protein
MRFFSKYIVATSLVLASSSGLAFGQAKPQCLCDPKPVAHTPVSVHRKMPAAKPAPPAPAPAPIVTQAQTPAPPPPPSGPSKFEEMMAAMMASQARAEEMAAAARKSEADARKAEADTKLVIAQNEAERIEAVEEKDAETRAFLARTDRSRADAQAKYLHTMGTVAKLNVGLNAAEIALTPWTAHLGRTQITESTNLSQTGASASAPTTVSQGSVTGTNSQQQSTSTATTSTTTTTTTANAAGGQGGSGGAGGLGGAGATTGTITVAGSPVTLTNVGNPTSNNTLKGAPINVQGSNAISGSSSSAAADPTANSGSSSSSVAAANPVITASPSADSTSGATGNASASAAASPGN